MKYSEELFDFQLSKAKLLFELQILYELKILSVMIVGNDEEHAQMHF